MLQRAFNAAARESPFVRHDLLGPGFDIRTIQDLFGHAKLSTTMIYDRVPA